MRPGWLGRSDGSWVPREVLAPTENRYQRGAGTSLRPRSGSHAPKSGEEMHHLNHEMHRLGRPGRRLLDRGLKLARKPNLRSRPRARACRRHPSRDARPWSEPVPQHLRQMTLAHSDSTRQIPLAQTFLLHQCSETADCLMARHGVRHHNASKCITRNIRRYGSVEMTDTSF